MVTIKTHANCRLNGQEHYILKSLKSKPKEFFSPLLHSILPVATCEVKKERVNKRLLTWILLPGPKQLFHLYTMDKL